jgi:hypothetical protein
MRVSLGGMLVASLVTLAYLFGLYSYRNDIFPIPALRALKSRSNTKAPDRYVMDQYGRLRSTDEKTPIDCPAQTDRTAVLLLLGQSNAGNHAGQRFRSEHEGRIANFVDGRCYIAASPLLGSDGIAGEYWTQLGNLLVGRGSFDRVILAPSAVTGSEVSRWQPGGDLNRAMTDTAVALTRSGYSVTHVLWVQGEIDYVRATREDDYRARFLAIVDSLRSHKVTAHVHVAVATKCLGAANGGTRIHARDNPVARAQLALPNLRADLRSGVNSDALLDDLDRYDDCHFGASGQHKVAKAWAELLSQNR